VKSEVKKLGDVGCGMAYYDWTAYAPVTSARFGSSGFNTMLGPGIVNLDLGVFRRFKVSERVNTQFRAEAFNFTNTSHLSNPSHDISSLVLNADGSFKSGVFPLTGIRNRGREGSDERTFRFGLLIGFRSRGIPGRFLAAHAGAGCDAGGRVAGADGACSPAGAGELIILAVR
jgi:hypothetical protein